MGHSIAMQRDSYDRRTLKQKVRLRISAADAVKAMFLVPCHAAGACLVQPTAPALGLQRTLQLRTERADDSAAV